MVISKNSQLGLRFKENATKVKLLKSLIDWLYDKVSDINEDLDFYNKTIENINKGESLSDEEKERIMLDKDSFVENKNHSTDTLNQIVSKLNMDVMDVLSDDGSKYFLITKGVYFPAQRIKIGDAFTSTIMKGLSEGKHTYLMGNDEMVRFVCRNACIKGIYYNEVSNKAFEFAFDIESGDFYFDLKFEKEFKKIAQLMTFIELGDIETIILEKGRNNGKSKDKGKIHNSTNYTVYVVDSSWNQLIIRTEGFAVIGHFRLQAYGEGLKDRKLIWINAHEKHGYTRRPKAEIID